MSAYCTVPEVETLGVKREAYADKSPAEITARIASTSDLMDSYLASRYTLPLAPPFPGVLKECCAALASCSLIDSGGRDPDADNLIDITRKFWMDWLKGVAAGSVTPPDVTDSTPDPGGGVASNARVVSSESRGYSVRGTGLDRGPFQTG